MGLAVAPATWYNIGLISRHYLRGMRGHDLIPGKYTNEAERGNNVDECLDEQYLSQIIARVAC